MYSGYSGSGSMPLDNSADKAIRARAMGLKLGGLGLFPKVGPVAIKRYNPTEKALALITFGLYLNVRKAEAMSSSMR
jgi:hypothetical protein